MKTAVIFSVILALISLSCKNSKIEQSIESSEELTSIDFDSSLFRIEHFKAEKFININAPSHFNYPESENYSKSESFQFKDFNGDSKEDVMIYLGDCGTGGCVYGVFLNQYKEYYSLGFMDYLKGPQLEKEKDGFWSIISYEELEAYDPSKLHVSVYKFDQEEYYYKLDTTYIYYDSIVE